MYVGRVGAAVSASPGNRLVGERSTAERGGSKYHLTRAASGLMESILCNKVKHCTPGPIMSITLLNVQ